MKIKKFVKLAENIPIVLSFRGYEVTYKAGKFKSIEPPEPPTQYRKVNLR